MEESAPAPAKPQSFLAWFRKSRGTTVVKNIGWQFATKVVTTLLALAAAGFVARALGPEGMGLYRNGQAVAGLLASVGVVVSQQVLIHRMLTHPDRESSYLGSAMVLVGVGGLVAMLVGALVPWSFEGTSGRLVVMAATSYFVVLFMVPMAAWFESRMAGRVLAVSNMAGLALTRVWEIGCSVLGVGVVTFAFSQPLGMVMMSALVVLAYRRRNDRPAHLQWDRTAARDMLTASLAWAGLGVVNHAQLRCELFFLTGMKGTAAGGQYSAASELVQPFLVIPGFMMSSLFPSVVRSYAADHDLGQARLVQYLRLSAALGLLSALSISVAGPFLAHLIYGPKFDAVAPMIRILGWYLVPAFLAPPCVAWMVKENLGWLAAIYSVAGLLLTVAIDLTLIPVAGAIGAAIATPLAALLIGTALPLLHGRTRWLAATQWRALFWPIPDLQAIIPKENRT
ncbi:oligosaccharide flippase family protein [Verrucomicrobium sp. BvORR034]|jgi:O-antigen/teichoic acid export membrane protein|uniref:oligosaccharide flippase family protein n=1 Tax=Verrucomicrobium sp. BvORR034 TaxID=1396418 RepID=UPI00067914DE|nr:oligosaccharide flippase family protein [Verrucomicrobium sp. BvORR034]